jgi:hypothetical protein
LLQGLANLRDFADDRALKADPAAFKLMPEENGLGFLVFAQLPSKDGGEILIVIS